MSLQIGATCQDCFVFCSTTGANNQMQVAAISCLQQGRKTSGNMHGCPEQPFIIFFFWNGLLMVRK
jgi:hypothetical protein